MTPLPCALSDESLSLPGDNNEVVARRAYILFLSLDMNNRKWPSLYARSEQQASNFSWIFCGLEGKEPFHTETSPLCC